MVYKTHRDNTLNQRRVQRGRGKNYGAKRESGVKRTSITYYNYSRVQGLLEPKAWHVRPANGRKQYSGRWRKKVCGHWMGDQEYTKQIQKLRPTYKYFCVWLATQ